MSTLAGNEQMRSIGWIALYTKANQERTAITNIERQDFSAYCPMIEHTRRHARKVETVRRPLFPSYVFVRLDAQKCQWRPLLSTIGVQSVIQFNNRPGFMPDGFVEELQVFEEQDKLRVMTAPKFMAGMEVKILNGPFQNLIAKVLSLPEKDRVWLLLDMMGRKVRIQHDCWLVTQK